MSLKDLNLSINYLGKDLSLVKNLVETVHYSKTIRSQQQTHVFCLKMNDRIVGAAIFGKPMSRHYELDTLELRRFVLIDQMPKNTESYFLSRCLKWIEKNDKDIVRIVTFADPNHGHNGVIYRASNFEFEGEELNGNPRVLLYNNKMTHIRQVYAKKQGSYTKDAIKYQQLMKSGEAKIIKQEKKLKYMYWFRK